MSTAEPILRNEDQNQPSPFGLGTTKLFSAGMSDLIDDGREGFGETGKQFGEFITQFESTLVTLEGHRQVFLDEAFLKRVKLVVATTPDMLDPEFKTVLAQLCNKTEDIESVVRLLDKDGNALGKQIDSHADLLGEDNLTKFHALKTRFELGRYIFEQHLLASIKMMEDPREIKSAKSFLAFMTNIRPDTARDVDKLRKKFEECVQAITSFGSKLSDAQAKDLEETTGEIPIVETDSYEGLLDPLTMREDQHYQSKPSWDPIESVASSEDVVIDVARAGMAKSATRTTDPGFKQTAGLFDLVPQEPQVSSNRISTFARKAKNFALKLGRNISDAVSQIPSMPKQYRALLLTPILLLGGSTSDAAVNHSLDVAAPIVDQSVHEDVQDQKMPVMDENQPDPLTRFAEIATQEDTPVLLAPAKIEQPEPVIASSRTNAPKTRKQTITARSQAAHRNRAIRNTPNVQHAEFSIPAPTVPVFVPAPPVEQVPTPTTPVVPPVDSTPEVPPVDITPEVPPVDITPEIPPVDDTPDLPVPDDSSPDLPTPDDASPDLPTPDAPAPDIVPAAPSKVDILKNLPELKIAASTVALPELVR